MVIGARLMMAVVGRNMKGTMWTEFVEEYGLVLLTFEVSSTVPTWKTSSSESLRTNVNVFLFI